MQPKIITLCGSMRFFDVMLEVAQTLTAGGHVVLAPFCVVAPDQQADSQLKQRLDRLHLDKIRMSHAISVVNVGGYIGESTKREIEFAKSIGVPAFYLEPVTDA